MSQCIEVKGMTKGRLLTDVTSFEGGLYGITFMNCYLTTEAPQVAKK